MQLIIIHHGNVKSLFLLQMFVDKTMQNHLNLLYRHLNEIPIVGKTMCRLFMKSEKLFEN